MDELSQLDELIESDVLEALGQNIPQDSETSDDEISIEDFNEDEILLEDLNEDEISIEDLECEAPDANENIDILEGYTEEPNDEIKHENEEVSIPQVNTTDLASLLSQLLNNKTIEITIKIKD